MLADPGDEAAEIIAAAVERNEALNLTETPSAPEYRGHFTIPMHRELGRPANLSLPGSQPTGPGTITLHQIYLH
jgi:hypothetical protein